MDIVVGIAICVLVCWFLCRIVFGRESFIWDYEAAEDLDVKEYRMSKTMEEAHRHRDKVLKKYHQY